jgi:FixJ family two-component response regulator
MQLCETYSGHIHLLLTDIVMPRTNGSELAERAALLRPNLKILFMSGYADDAVERKDISTGERPILQKPFTAQSLLRCVRETLDVDSDPQKV